MSGLLAAVTVVLLKTNPSGLPLGYRLIGLLAALICATPLLLRRRHDTGFPLLGVFCAIQGIYLYIAALISSPSLPFQTTYTIRIRELGLLGSLAYVSLVVAVGLLARRIRPVLPSIRRWTSSMTEPSSQTFTRSVLLFIIGLATIRFLPARISSGLGSIPAIIALLRIVAFSIMLLLWLRGNLTPTKKAVVILALLMDFVSGTSTQFELYSAAGVAISGMILLLVFRPRLAAWLLLPMIPILLVLNVAKTEARANPIQPSGPFGAVHALLSDSLDTALHPAPGALTTSAWRFGYNSDLLGYIEQNVPSEYPYWNKQTYIDMPLILIPRVLAPFKPKVSLGNEFGREYGLLGANDFLTSENTPLQVEAFANFGPEGLVGIAIIVGLLLGLGEGLFDRRRVDGVVIGTVVAYQLSAGIESGASNWALVVWIVILLVPVVRWAIGGRLRGHLNNGRPYQSEVVSR